MEVPGRTIDMYCLPCSTDDLTEPAYGYCQNCQEHLCEACFRHHRRSGASRDHVLLNKDAMPTLQTVPSQESSEETEFCESHADKKIEFYCRRHSTTACYVCVTLEHKDCHVDYIPDVSDNVQGSEDMVNLMTEIKYLKEVCQTKLRIIEEAKENLLKCKAKALNSISVFRKEINDCLDQMETKINSEIDNLLESDETTRAVVNETCQEIMNILEEREASLNEENPNKKLFVEMRKTEEVVSNLKQTSVQIVESSKLYNGFEFIENNEFLDVLNTQTFGRIILPDEYQSVEGGNSLDMGSQSVEKTTGEKMVDLRPVASMDAKSSSDKMKCDIAGIVLIPPKSIAVADRANYSIKLLGMDRYKLMSEIKVSSRPTDVISLSENEIAVALPNDKRIHIMSHKRTTLSLEKSLYVGETCRGLAFCQGKLVAICGIKPGKLVIMNLEGQKLNVFDTPGLLTTPEKVVVSRDGKSLYITDWPICKHRLIKMDWQGNILQMFDDNKYSRPAGIQELKDGTVLVCYASNDTIVRISNGFRECAIKGLDRTNLYCPKTMTYCEANQRLYVSCASRPRGQNECIEVFDVKLV